MEIRGKVWCLFVQSGTFKNQFKKLGYDAVDVDIQNNFGETDHVIDLFAEIEKAYSGEASIFDAITTDDLIMAFFPCIYFESMQMPYYSLDTNNLRKKNLSEKHRIVIERIKNREKFYLLLHKLVAIANIRGLRLIIENPATPPHYLLFTQNFPKPTFIDNNRMLRGDYFVKPTAYWFFNCEPTHGFTYQRDKKQKIINKCKSGVKAGICSEERSMISPDYARNFICDFIIGKCQTITQPSLFDNDSDLSLPDKI